MLGGRGTLHFGVALSRDIVSPVKNPETNPDGADLNFAKKTNGFSLGWTWVFGRGDLADLSLSLMNLSGYLTDPYKVVPIGPSDSTETVPENRPTRARGAPSSSEYSHYFLWDGSVNVLYRYYNDDWSITANTLDLTYNQPSRPGLDRLSRDPLLHADRRVLLRQPVRRCRRPTCPRTTGSRPSTSFLGGLTVSHRLNEVHQRQRRRDVSSPSTAAIRIILVPTSPDERGTTSVSAADMNVLTIILRPDLPLLKNASGSASSTRDAFPSWAASASSSSWTTAGPRRPSEIARAVETEALRIERKFSRYRETSVVSEINRNAGRTPVAVDEETEMLVQVRARARADDGRPLRSDGRRSAPRLGLQERPRALGRGDRGAASARATPTPSRSATGRSFSARPGWRSTSAASARSTPSTGPRGFCASEGIRSAIVNFAGDVRTIGSRGDGRPWKVGVVDPHDRGRCRFAVRTLGDAGIATSGDYERGFVKDGVRYHHILDARTGWPARGLSSVTSSPPRPFARDGLPPRRFSSARRRASLCSKTPPESRAR